MVINVEELFYAIIHLYRSGETLKTIIEDYTENYHGWKINYRY